MMDKKIAVGLVGVIIAFGWIMVYKYQNPSPDLPTAIKVNQPDLNSEIYVETGNNGIITHIPSIDNTSIVEIPQISVSNDSIYDNIEVTNSNSLSKHFVSEDYISRKKVFLLNLRPIQAEYEQIDKDWQKLAKYIDISSYEEIELK